MSPDNPKGNGHHAYRVACDRIMTDVMGLVRARGILIGVDIDPGLRQLRLGTDRRRYDLVVHQIELTYGRRTRLVPVDHETFMEAEFFRTLVLHQIEAAIDELARGA